MSRLIHAGRLRGGRAMLFGVLALAACSGPAEFSAPPAGVETLSGTVAIPVAEGDLASPQPSGSASCTGQGVLADIHEGTQIIVRDGAGTILESGSLGPGQIVLGNEGPTCSFEFEVPDIPLGANFYTVQVAERAVRIYSADQLAADGWTIAIAPVGGG